LPATAALSGTTTDDGLPNQPGALTRTWTKVSGPGTVTFANASAASTTATFSTSGTYDLRLTASDSVLSTSDEVLITVNPASTASALEIQYRAGDSNGTDNQLRPQFNLINTGTTAIPLTQVKFRYWYTREERKTRCSIATSQRFIITLAAHCLPRPSCS
jgi:hypothetical protein